MEKEKKKKKKKEKKRRKKKKESRNGGGRKCIGEVCFLHTFSNFVNNSRKPKFRPIIVREPLKPTSSWQTSFRQQRPTSKTRVFSSYTFKSFVKSFTILALERWPMSISSLRWDILATPPWVRFFSRTSERGRQRPASVFSCSCVPGGWHGLLFALRYPGSLSAHLTNDLQATTVLS